MGRAQLRGCLESVRLREFTVLADDERYDAGRFGAVTFGPADRVYVAHHSAAGGVVLVGDLGARELVPVLEGANAPVVGPDGLKVAFVPDAGGLAVLDVATGTTIELAERGTAHDAAWVDGDTLVYARDGDLWRLDLDGEPVLWIEDAASPTVHR